MTTQMPELQPLSTLFDIPNSREVKQEANVSFTYQRLGPGDTLSMWKINSNFFYEDHKAGRPSFSFNYGAVIPNMISVLEGKHDILVAKAIFLFHSDDNPGHTLSNVMRALTVASTIDDDIYVVIPEHILQLGSVINFLIMSRFSVSRILVISSLTKVTAEVAYLYEGLWAFILKLNRNLESSSLPTNSLLLNKVQVGEFVVPNEVTYIQDLFSSNHTEFCGRLPRRVCLIKTASAPTTSGMQRGFSDEYLKLIDQYGFTILDSSTLDIVYLYAVLRNAKKIVSSWGAISFINKLFFNPAADILYLCHEGYSKEYDNSWWQLLNCYASPAKSIKYLFHCPTELDMVNEALLEEWLC